jgi:hypothetical protein
VDDKRLQTPRGLEHSHDTGDVAVSGSLQSIAERLAQSIRETPFPPGEVAEARKRVGELLAAAMAEQAPAYASRTAIARRRSPRSITLLRGLAAAAALIVLLALTVGISRASAAALPSSPLYGIKRAEEWVALNTAWSDQRRGDVLVVIARRRLDELTRESGGDTAIARSLAAEYQSDVVAIIDLAGKMAASHEDTRGLSVQLASVLTAQHEALQAAVRSGDRELADALRAAGRAAKAAIDRNHVILPGPVPILDDGATPDGTRPASGAASPTHTPAASPPPSSSGRGSGTQGSGSGKNNGSPGTSGNKGGGGTSNGDGGNRGNGGSNGYGGGGSGGAGSRGKTLALTGGASHSGNGRTSAGSGALEPSSRPASKEHTPAAARTGATVRLQVRVARP